MNALQRDLQDVFAKHVALQPHKIPRLLELLADDGPVVLPFRRAAYTGDRFINVDANGRPTTGDDYVAIYDQERDETWAADALPVGSHPEVTLAAQKLTLLGFTDWKVAGVKQVIGGPVDYTRFNPVLDKRHFGRWPSALVWTSTPDTDPAAAASCAFVVVLDGGDVIRGRRGVQCHALAVRAGQPLGFQF